MPLVRPPQAYPAGVKKQDHQGKLPLHYAAEFNSCDIEVFQLLLDEYPEGISIKNKWGQLPLHVACWRNAPGLPAINIRNCPLVDEFCFVLPDDVIELLYTKSPPGAAEMIDTLAMLPPAQHTLSKTLAKLTAAA